MVTFKVVNVTVFKVTELTRKGKIKRFHWEKNYLSYFIDEINPVSPRQYISDLLTGLFMSYLQDGQSDSLEVATTYIIATLTL